MYNIYPHLYLTEKTHEINKSELINICVKQINTIITLAAQNYTNNNYT